MQRIDNWQEVSARASAEKTPIVVMVDQEDCPYCERAEEEFFSALLANETWRNRAIYGKISLDYLETIIDKNGASIATRKFLKPYKADLTPTVLFLDSEGRELSERIIGLPTPDYYLFYLEQAIDHAWQALNL